MVRAAHGVQTVAGSAKGSGEQVRVLLLNHWGIVVSAVMIMQFHVMPVVAYWCERCGCTVGSKGIKVVFGICRKSSFARHIGMSMNVMSIYLGAQWASILTDYPSVKVTIFLVLERMIYKFSREVQIKQLKDES